MSLPRFGIASGITAIVALAACGGTVSVGESGGSPSAGCGSLGASGTSAGPCPATSPANDSPCTGVPDQLRCTYGDSVRPDERDVSICKSGSWKTTPGACAEPSTGACPVSEPGFLAACPTYREVCVYGNALCSCGCDSGGGCEPNYEWLCADPPNTPGCPPVVPNDGTACSAEGVHCEYGTACTPTGAVVNCTNGAWTWNTMVLCG